MNDRLSVPEQLRPSSTAWLTVGFFMMIAVLFGGWLTSAGLFDVDEAIFAQASVEMLENNDYVNITYNNEPRYHKPPLIYWLQAAAMHYMDNNVLAARLPSVLFGFLSVWMFYQFVGNLSGNRRYALISSAILGTSLSFLVITRAATADAALNFFVIASTFTLLANLFARKTSWIAMIMGGFMLAGGVLAKGPVALMVPGIVIAVAVFARPHVQFNFWRGANPLVVTAALIVGIIPWVYLMITANGFEFFKEFWLVHNWQRFAGGMGVSHSSSPYYYIWVLLLGMFPWVLFIPQALGWVSFKFMRRLRSPLPMEVLPALGAVWFLSVVIFFSFSQTKLAHYIVPALPGAALLIGGFLAEQKRLSKWYLLTLPIIAMFGGLLVVFKQVPNLLQNQGVLAPYMEQLCGALGCAWPITNPEVLAVASQDVTIGYLPFVAGWLIIIGVGLGLWFLTKYNRFGQQQNFNAGLTVVGGSMGLALICVVAGVVPVIYSLMQQPLVDIGEQIRKNYRTGDKVFMVATHHPSVRFASGINHTPLGSVAQMATIKPFNGRGFFVVEESMLEAASKYYNRRQTGCRGGYCLMVTVGATKTLP